MRITQKSQKAACDPGTPNEERQSIFLSTTNELQILNLSLGGQSEKGVAMFLCSK